MMLSRSRSSRRRSHSSRRRSPSPIPKRKPGRPRKLHAVEKAQPTRRPGRPRLEKPADSHPLPKKPRGRPRKNNLTRSPEPDPSAAAAAVPHPYSIFFERPESPIKEVVDLLKKTALDFPSDMSSSLDTYGTLFEGCCKTYNDEKERFVKLQNDYEEFHGTFRVYLRVKPVLPEDSNEDVVEFHTETDPCVAISSRQSSSFKKLNHAFINNESQGDVFDHIRPLVYRVAKGRNLCVLAYGQSGSGKTYSMFGPSRNTTFKDAEVAETGLCQLAIKEIFGIIEGDPNDKWTVEFSMRDILKRKVTNLLDTEDPPIIVNSFPETLKLLNKAVRNRTTRATKLNSQSSRSHCILELKVKTEGLCGCLQMVDLAGSGKYDPINNKSTESNTGLLFLNNVMAALSKNGSYIPYTSNPLTRSLESSLGGNSKVVVLAHVSPLEKFFSETMRTLTFANDASNVRNGVIETLRKELGTIQDEICKRKATKAPGSNTTRKCRTPGQTKMSALKSAKKERKGMMKTVKMKVAQGTNLEGLDDGYRQSVGRSYRVPDGIDEDELADIGQETGGDGKERKRKSRDVDFQKKKKKST